MPRTFRNPGLRSVLLAGAGAMVVIGWVARSLPLTVGLLGFWFVLSAVSWRVRVVADAREVRIVNYLHTHRLSWGQVAKVELDPTAPGDGLARFRLRSGGSVRAWGLNSGAQGLGYDGIVDAVADLDCLRRDYDGPREPKPPDGARPTGLGRVSEADPRLTGRVIGCLLAGVGALMFAGWLLSNYVAFAHFGVDATATVTAVSGYKSADVTVRYLANGTMLANTAQEWLGWPHVGDQVAVVYDGRDPSRVTDAAVAGTRGALVEALWVAGVGLVALAGGGYALVLRRSASRR